MIKEKKKHYFIASDLNQCNLIKIKYIYIFEALSHYKYYYYFKRNLEFITCVTANLGSFLFSFFAPKW